MTSVKERPPTRWRASSTRTSTPARCSWRAAARPEKPAPTTTTSHSRSSRRPWLFPALPTIIAGRCAASSRWRPGNPGEQPSSAGGRGEPRAALRYPAGVVTTLDGGDLGGPPRCRPPDHGPARGDRVGRPAALRRRRRRRGQDPGPDAAGGPTGARRVASTPTAPWSPRSAARRPRSCARGCGRSACPA